MPAKTFQRSFRHGLIVVRNPRISDAGLDVLEHAAAAMLPL
tara:strand:- start:528 stop:650 length:123 start_codon:yes stop_codon:yes gene_type:complete